MIKAILFDADGMVIRKHPYFSQRFKEKYGLRLDVKAQDRFFKNEFLLCETGKADLKEELKKQLSLWQLNWSAEEVLKFWFEGEAEVDMQMIETIKLLRQQGIKCYLATNNEKYRVNYFLDNVGLRKSFDGCFASCDLGYLKSQKEFWEAVEKFLIDYAPSEILVWDDDPKNTISAKAFGCHAELYTDFKSFKNKIVNYLNTRQYLSN